MLRMPRQKPPRRSKTEKYLKPDPGGSGFFTLRRLTSPLLLTKDVTKTYLCSGGLMKYHTRRLSTAILFSFLALSSAVVTSCVSGTAGSVTTNSVSMPLRQRADAMAQILQDGVTKNIAAGFAVALSDANGRTEKAFIGLAERETNRPIDNDTVYRLYSMTKPVTAVAIMILVEEGKINLDAPLATYIPSFATAKVYVSGDTLATLVTTGLERPLTVRDLMRQTAGMPYIGAEKPVEKFYFAAGIERAPGEAVPGLSGRRVTNLQELADRVAATPLSSQPGAIFTYGNAIDVLGRVVEIGSGQSLGTFFQQHIFAPLKMTHTAFSVLPGDVGHLASAYFSKSPNAFTSPFLAKVPLSDVQSSVITLADAGSTSIYNSPARIEFGGSGLVGTLDDYVRFARMIANSGELDGTRILKPMTITEMGRDQLSAVAAQRLHNSGRSYGLGFGRILDPIKSNSAAPAGTMFWSGAAGTYFWANPATKESGVIMTQIFGENISVYQGAAIRAAHGAIGN
jgi:CubicO group peptidase (beta-lactamase class C family)